MSTTNEGDLIHMLILLSKKARHLNEVLVYNLNISINELYILYAAETSGVISLKELKEDLELQPTSLSRILGKMYDDELINRSFGSIDKRSINITSTKKGKKVIAASKKLLKQVVKDSILNMKDAKNGILKVILLLDSLWNLHKKNTSISKKKYDEKG